MTDTATIWLQDTEKTKSAGASLGASFYDIPVTILLEGELGAGKTTFLQGFAEALGIPDAITSPTYALEQRHQTSQWGELLHIDLYRLSAAEAHRLITSSADHPGIRCIEWADRLPEEIFPPRIAFSFSDEENGRQLMATFEDIPLPTREQILVWRREVALPNHIVRHCDAIAELCDELVTDLLDRAIIVRPLLLRRAAEVHDLLRFIDFRTSAGPDGHEPSAKDIALWNDWKQRFPNMRHEEACAQFLRSQGFNALARVVEPHGLRLPSPQRTTIEQQLLFYADKRVALDRLVTLEERFEDFANRYGNGHASTRGKIWYAEAKSLERKLFPDGVPV